MLPEFLSLLVFSARVISSFSQKLNHHHQS